MEYADLVPNEDLDLSVKIVARTAALVIQMEPRLFERLKWKERRVKVQISMTPGIKRLRLLSSNTTGWDVVDKKSKGLEVAVRQLAVLKKCIRKCSASILSDALIIDLPDDFEPKNKTMILGPVR